jgi:hypothetical protein
MKGFALYNASTRILFFVFLVFIFILSLASMRGADYWWQLLDGERNLSTWMLNAGPAFTFGESRQPYYDEYFLYDVLLTLLVKALGDPGVLVCFALIAVVPFVHLFSQKQTAQEPFKVFLLSLFIFYFAFQRNMQRPEIVGTLILYLVGAWLLEQKTWQKTRKAQIALFLFFFLWANVHVSFILGLFIVLLWAGESWIRTRDRDTFRLIVRTLAVSLGGTLLNPYGPIRWWLPFRNQADFWTIVNSFELHPLLDHKVFEFVLLNLVFVIFSIWHRATVPRWVMAFFLVTALMTISHMRYASLMTTALLWAVRGSLGFNVCPRSRPPSALWIFTRTTLFLLLSLALLSYNLVALWLRLPQSLTPAYHHNYSPTTVKLLTQSPGPHFILSSIEVVSYAAPFGQGQNYVLCDTGQGRFDPQTLRYLYYLYNYPQALAYALDRLNVDHVIVNEAISHWAPVCQNDPRWSCIAQTQDGLLFQKKAGPGTKPTTEAQPYFENLTQRGKFLEAYLLSEGLLEPTFRADLLMRAFREQTNHYFTNFWPFLQLSITRLPASALNSDHQLISQIKNKDWLKAAETYHRIGAKLHTANFVGANIYLQANRRPEAFQVSKLFSRHTAFDAGAAELHAILLPFRHELNWPQPPPPREFSLLAFSSANQKWFVEYTEVLNQRINFIKKTSPPLLPN